MEKTGEKGKGRAPGTAPFTTPSKRDDRIFVYTICISEFLRGGGLVSCQIGSMEVRSEAQKKPLATNCVFLSAEGCSEGIEGAAGGGREGGGREGGGRGRGGERKKSPQPSHQVEH